MYTMHVTSVEKLFTSAVQSNNFSGRLIKMPHIWQGSAPLEIRTVFYVHSCFMRNLFWAYKWTNLERPEPWHFNYVHLTSPMYGGDLCLTEWSRRHWVDKVFSSQFFFLFKNTLPPGRQCCLPLLTLTHLQNHQIHLFWSGLFHKTTKNSVFPCSEDPACKGGLEGLCLTPETRPRRWRGAKWAKSCAAPSFSRAQSCAAISPSPPRLKISLGQEEQSSQRRCTWYFAV